MDPSKLPLLLLYVLPGFLTLEIYRSYYPVRKKSYFEMLMWSFFWSFIILGIVTAIDSLIHHFHNKHDQLNYFIINSNPYTLKTYILIFGVSIIFGYLLVFQYKLRFIWPWLNKKFPIDFGNTWPYINDKTNGSYVVVFLKEGETYLGWISHFTYVPDDDDQDFILSGAKRVDEDLNVKYPVQGEGVYLNTRDVKCIEYLNPVNNNSTATEPASE